MEQQPSIQDDGFQEIELNSDRASFNLPESHFSPPNELNFEEYSQYEEIGTMSSSASEEEENPIQDFEPIPEPKKKIVFEFKAIQGGEETPSNSVTGEEEENPHPNSEQNTKPKMVSLEADTSSTGPVHGAATGRGQRKRNADKEEEICPTCGKYPKHAPIERRMSI